MPEHITIGNDAVVALHTKVVATLPGPQGANGSPGVPGAKGGRGETGSEGIWEAGPEIDILENFGGGSYFDPKATYWAGPGGGKPSPVVAINKDFNPSKGGVGPREWHTYACDWREDRIEFIYDGKIFSVVTTRSDLSYPAGVVVTVVPFINDRPMHAIVNLAGRNGQVPPAGTLPISIEADYVRIWKRD